MEEKLPAIHLLKAFEASARHLSFKGASEELHLTASAVSQKIKQLEECLSVSLFTRMTRSLALTQEGQDYKLLAKEVLSFYQQRQRDFLRRYSRRKMRLSMIPFVANDIVLPSLPEYQDKNPDTELKIEALTTLVDFSDGAMDAAIRFGLGEWSGLVATPFCRCKIVLVASKSVLEKNPINTLSDLENHSLISMRGAESAWPDVANKFSLPFINNCRSLEVDSYLASMVAAQQGLGVAIGIKPIINPWIADGRLTQVLDIEVEIEKTYYFVRRIQDRDDIKLQQLYIWLKSLFSQREERSIDIYNQA